MNQILEFGTEKRGKTPKGNKGGGSSSDKVVRVFAILLMIFAIVLIGSGVYSLMQNKENSSNNNSNTPISSTSQANINAIVEEANNQVILTVDSEIAISRVVYNWNTNTEMTIDGQGELTLEEDIDLPSGNNTLNVKVIDVQGNETTKSFDFESDSGDDIISPNLTLELTEDKNLLITATDETAMSFITYRWNDDEETTVYVDENAEDKTTITVEIEIPRGTNTITVVAVDASSKYNTVTETQTFNGVTRPEISYELSADGSEIIFHCTHESGIKEIYYTLNDQPYSVTFNEEEGYPTEAEFSQKWDQGYNYIKLTVTSSEDTENVFESEYNYGEAENTEETNENSNSTNTTNTTNTTETDSENNTNTTNE